MEPYVDLILRPVMHFLFVILQVFKASAEPLAAIIVAVVAIVGLRTWHREFVGRRRMRRGGTAGETRG
jgi:hypothetical protein